MEADSQLSRPLEAGAHVRACHSTCPGRRNQDRLRNGARLLWRQLTLAKSGASLDIDGSSCRVQAGAGEDFTRDRVPYDAVPSPRGHTGGDPQSSQSRHQG